MILYEMKQLLWRCGKTLKEIYEDEYEPNPEYGVQEKFNKILDKTEAELSVEDICFLLRQKLFLGTAIPAALMYLVNNPLEGEMYEGEMISGFENLDENELIGYKDLLKAVIHDGYEKAEKYDWIDAEEKEDYLYVLKNVEKLIV